MRTKQETRSYKRTNSNQKRSINQSTHNNQQTYTNQKINAQKKREQLSKNNNQNKLWNIISVVFVFTCLAILITVIFFGRKQPEYIGDHYCMNVEWGEYCVDHRVPNEEIDNSDAWILLILLFIPGVGFVVGISMIPAYGVIPFIIREIFVLVPYLEKKLK